MSSPSAPTWLIALLVIFALTAMVTFSLFLYKHAEAASLSNQHTQLKEFEPVLEVRQQQAKDLKAALEMGIRQRHERRLSLEENMKSWTGDIDRLVQGNKARLGDLATSTRKEVKTYAELMKEAPERRIEVTKEEKRAFENDHQLDDSRRKLRDEIEKVAQEFEQDKKRSRSELVRLDVRVEELESRVRFLTNQVDIASREMRPDGKVVAAASAQVGYVVIDKGYKHNLRKGTKFVVFALRGGRIVLKGDIEVVKLEERLATCRVVQEYSANDPFIDGDFIHNPVWDPDRVKSFAIRGDFKRFSKTEISRFIEEGGGRVDSDLKVGTDYLVAGGAAEQWTDIAVKLGVSILSEDQLIDFIRPQE
ncbi:MAG: BRCT domain-containing protein [Planctomycetota bacterium]|mgnify:CR=1 FL=1